MSQKEKNAIKKMLHQKNCWVKKEFECQKQLSAKKIGSEKHFAPKQILGAKNLAQKNFMLGKASKKKVKLGLLAEVEGAGGLSLRGVQGPNPVIRYFFIALK